MAEVTIMVNKAGRSGRPMATIFTDPKLSTDDLGKLVQTHITRNRDLLKKVGLKACLACVSGFDIDIRQRYDVDMRVEF